MNGNDGKSHQSPVRPREKVRSSPLLKLKREPEFLAPFFSLFDHPEKRFEAYIKKGQKVVDLGCGWGHFSFLLADKIGPGGKVYAVDIDNNCILSIRKKAKKRGYLNIEAIQSTAADLNFIIDHTVDFILANGLFCVMEFDRDQAVFEIERILKPDGMAYISLGGAPPWGYVDETEWNKILSRFSIVKGGNYRELWAMVLAKQAWS